MQELSGADLRCLTENSKSSVQKVYKILISYAKRNRAPFQKTTKTYSTYNKKSRGPRTLPWIPSLAILGSISRYLPKIPIFQVKDKKNNHDRLAYTVKEMLFFSNMRLDTIKRSRILRRDYRKEYFNVKSPSQSVRAVSHRSTAGFYTMKSSMSSGKRLTFQKIGVRSIYNRGLHISGKYRDVGD